MQKLTEVSAGGNQKKRNPQVKKIAFHRCMQLLDHAFQCRDNKCSLHNCMRMKAILSHSGNCKYQQTQNCGACSQLVALNCYHSQTCEAALCPLPYCVNVKQKMKRQKMTLAPILNRRFASMPPEYRKMANQRCMESLEHACQCRDAKCSLHSCIGMKAILSHSKNCKNQQNQKCWTCKQLIALNYYHAKTCGATLCPLPYCARMKQKMKRWKTIMTSISKFRLVNVSPEYRRMEFRRSVQSFEHVCHGRSAKCCVRDYKIMKASVFHFANCKIRQREKCTFCWIVLSFGFYHARKCVESKCPYPYCVKMKQLLKRCDKNFFEVIQRSNFEQCIAAIQNQGMNDAVK